MSNETNNEITATTDFDFMAVYKKQKEIQKQKALLNRVVIFAKLKELGIKKVMVNYEGSGDSGDFERPYAVEDEDLINDSPGRWATEDAYEKTVFATEKVTIAAESSTFDYQTEQWVDSSKNVEMTLGEAIKDITYSLLETKHPGWEINDGSDGKFAIDVETEEITLDHNEYETVSTNYVYSWEEDKET